MFMNKKFKKFLSAVLAVVMVFCTVPVMSYALEEGKKYSINTVDDPFGYNEITYDIYNGKARILSYSYPDLYDRDEEEWIVGDDILAQYAIVEIPDTINGYEVAYIGRGAFFTSDDESLPYTNTLILPDTIIEIGEGAFNYCSLSKLVLPNNTNTTYKGYSVYCHIREVILPDGIETVDFSIYLGSLGKIVIPGSVKNFNSRTAAIASESYVGTIVLSEGVETLGFFMGGDNDLDKLVLPKSLKEIESDALLDSATPNYIYYSGTKTDWQKIDTENQLDRLLKRPSDNVNFICAPSPYIVESVDIIAENVELILGETKTLETTIKGNSEDTSIFTPIYKSSDESVATVDQNGKVTALKKGTAIITCSASDDSKTVSDTCTVNVVDAVEKVDITPDVLEIYSGTSKTLTTNITANTNDTSLYTITYTSSDEDVARVDENGKVTAYGRGTATITCTVTDDNDHTVSDTCEVTVKYTFWRWLLRVFLYIIGVNSRI